MLKKVRTIIVCTAIFLFVGLLIFIHFDFYGIKIGYAISIMANMFNDNSSDLKNSFLIQMNDFSKKGDYQKFLVASDDTVSGNIISLFLLLLYAYLEKFFLVSISKNCIYLFKSLIYHTKKYFRKNKKIKKHRGHLKSKWKNTIKLQRQWRWSFL